MKNRSFFKKWNNKVMEDWGCVVSDSFNKFQNAFKREMSNIATEIGGTLVSYNKGHYSMSGFIKKGDRFVYFSFSNFGFRSCANLTNRGTIFVREAENEKDYRGGTNHNISYLELIETLKKLLK